MSAYLQGSLRSKKGQTTAAALVPAPGVKQPRTAGGRASTTAPVIEDADEEHATRGLAGEESEDSSSSEEDIPLNVRRPVAKPASTSRPASASTTTAARSPSTAPNPSAVSKALAEPPKLRDTDDLRHELRLRDGALGDDGDARGEDALWGEVGRDPTTIPSEAASAPRASTGCQPAAAVASSASWRCRASSPASAATSTVADAHAGVAMHLEPLKQARSGATGRKTAGMLNLGKAKNPSALLGAQSPPREAPRHAVQPPSSSPCSSGGIESPLRARHPSDFPQPQPDRPAHTAVLRQGSQSSDLRRELPDELRHSSREPSRAPPGGASFRQRADGPTSAHASAAVLDATGRRYTLPQVEVPWGTEIDELGVERQVDATCLLVDRPLVAVLQGLVAIHIRREALEEWLKDESCLPHGPAGLLVCMRDPTNRASNIVAEVLDVRHRSGGGGELEMRGPPDWRPLNRWFGIEYVSNRELGEAELLQACRQLKDGYISRLEIRTITHHAERLRRCYRASNLPPSPRLIAEPYASNDTRLLVDRGFLSAVQTLGSLSIRRSLLHAWHERPDHMRRDPVGMLVKVGAAAAGSTRGEMCEVIAVHSSRAALTVRGPANWRPLERDVRFLDILDEPLSADDVLSAWQRLRDGFFTRLQCGHAKSIADRLRDFLIRLRPALAAGLVPGLGPGPGPGLHTSLPAGHVGPGPGGGCGGSTGEVAVGGRGRMGGVVGIGGGLHTTVTGDDVGAHDPRGTAANACAAGPRITLPDAHVPHGWPPGYAPPPLPPGLPPGYAPPPLPPCAPLPSANPMSWMPPPPVSQAPAGFGGDGSRAPTPSTIAWTTSVAAPAPCDEDAVAHIVAEVVRAAGFEKVHIMNLVQALKEHPLANEIAQRMPGRDIRTGSVCEWLTAPSQAARFTLEGSGFMAIVMLRSTRQPESHAQVGPPAGVPAGAPAESRGSDWKTRAVSQGQHRKCAYYARGACKYGSRCAYRHDSDLRSDARVSRSQHSGDRSRSPLPGRDRSREASHDHRRPRSRSRSRSPTDRDRARHLANPYY